MVFHHAQSAARPPSLVKHPMQASNARSPNARTARWRPQPLQILKSAGCLAFTHVLIASRALQHTQCKPMIAKLHVVGLAASKCKGCCTAAPTKEPLRRCRARNHRELHSTRPQAQASMRRSHGSSAAIKSNPAPQRRQSASAHTPSNTLTAPSGCQAQAAGASQPAGMADQQELHT